MMGTFARFLGEKRIPTHPSVYRAEARGYVGDVDGVLRVGRIEVCYHLAINPEQRAAAESCLDVYLTSCPAAMSVKECIRLDHSLSFEE